MIEVVLSPDEVHLAAMHGLLRRFQKISGRRGDRIQKERSTWDNEIEGACAELAFCKWRDVYWSGVTDLRAKDGGRLDVRWTKHRDKGGLIVYPHEDDGTCFVLVDGFAPVYRIVGWSYGISAKQPQYRCEFGYLVPRDSKDFFLFGRGSPRPVDPIEEFEF